MHSSTQSAVAQKRADVNDRVIMVCGVRFLPALIIWLLLLREPILIQSV